MLRPPQRVLLVEDSELARRSLIETLTGAGFRIAGEAASAAVARSLAPRLAYDIALIDIYLKDGDGIDLAAELRAGGATAKLVMFTCSHKPNDLLRALRAGVDGYVTKDAEPARLLREAGGRRVRRDADLGRDAGHAGARVPAPEPGAPPRGRARSASG